MKQRFPTILVLAKLILGNLDGQSNLFNINLSDFFLEFS